MNRVMQLQKTSRSIRSLLEVRKLKIYGRICTNQFQSSFHKPVIETHEKKFIVFSPHSPVEIPEVSIQDYVWRDVDKWPDEIALVCGMSGRSYSYGNAYDLSKRFGSALLRKGAARGDILAIILPNLPEFPIICLGCLGAGLAYTTINPTYTPREIAHQLEASGARYLVTIEPLMEGVNHACKIYNGIELRIMLSEEEQAPEGFTSFRKMLGHEDGSLYGMNKIDIHDDLAILPFTSGTTGMPKGIFLTHYNIVANMTQAQHPNILQIPRPSDHHDHEVTIAILPFSHIYAMTTIMMMGLQFGAKIVTMPLFIPELYIAAMRTHLPTLLHLVPPLVSFLATNKMVLPTDLKSLKFVIGGAAPCPPQIIHELKDKAGHDFDYREGYGMSEMSPVITWQPGEGCVHGSCGQLVPNTKAKVVDVNGEAVGPKAEGELYVNGPQLMKEYFKNPDVTRESIVKGWFRTGDVGYFDEDGHFFITDRLKEMIKTQGLQVSPSELEMILREHPDVVDAAVVGVPHDRMGEVPKAFVVKKKLTASKEGIVEFVSNRVAKHKRLTGGVEFVHSFPVSATGKVLKKELTKGQK